MALYPFSVHVSALELHALSHYPGNRQNDRQNTNRLAYAFTAHAHQGIISTKSPTTASNRLLLTWWDPSS